MKGRRGRPRRSALGAGNFRPRSAGSKNWRERRRMNPHAPPGAEQGGAKVPYSELLVRPMREELTSAGVKELRTPEEVDAFMNEKTGTAMLVVNSVCGCAAGMARPGVRHALQGDRRPDRVASVFAGQDLEATARARS